MVAPPAWTNLGAEVRGVEQGHRARLDRARGLFLVKSDTDLGTTYELTAAGVPAPQGDPLVVVTCSCPAGGDEPPAPGVAGCKHRALVLRRLERERLVRFDGLHWRVTDRARRLASRGLDNRPRTR